MNNCAKFFLPPLSQSNYTFILATELGAIEGWREFRYFDTGEIFETKVSTN
jgi:hypothetical protein